MAQGCEGRVGGSRRRNAPTLRRPGECNREKWVPGVLTQAQCGTKPPCGPSGSGPWLRPRLSSPGAQVLSNVVPAAVNLAGSDTWALPSSYLGRDQPGCQDGHGTQWAGALGMGGYMYPVTRSRAPGNKNNDSRYIARFMLRQSVAVILVLLTENGPAPGNQHGHALGPAAANDDGVDGSTFG